MKITIKVEKETAGSEQLMKAQLALLSMFAMCDDVFTEDDAMAKEKRRMTMGRIYEEWKRCRAILDPTFDPKKHDQAINYGMKLFRDRLPPSATG